MKIQSLLQNLPFIGQAEGERLTYYVFEGNHAYLVVSPNSRGGLSMNVVDQETPEVISRRFGGQRVTGRMLVFASTPVVAFARRLMVMRIDFTQFTELMLHVRIGVLPGVATFWGSGTIPPFWS